LISLSDDDFDKSGLHKNKDDVCKEEEIGTTIVLCSASFALVISLIIETHLKLDD
jgi:hypothetical protein